MINIFKFLFYLYFNSFQIIRKSLNKEIFIVDKNDKVKESSI